MCACDCSDDITVVRAKAVAKLCKYCFRIRIIESSSLCKKVGENVTLFTLLEQAVAVHFIEAEARIGWNIVIE